MFPSKCASNIPLVQLVDRFGKITRVNLTNPTEKMTFPNETHVIYLEKFLCNGKSISFENTTLPPLNYVKILVLTF